MPDSSHMVRALELARRGLGYVEPNPAVGCVLVRAGRVIGEGFHKRFGGPHAEVEALADCRRRGRNPKGCDVYVTLEPCCHHGKTPPCTDALIAARVGRVIVAVGDPSPHVAGGGLRALRKAGIRVDVGMCEAEARELNRAFFKRVATGLPWVIAKWAQTIDGKVATAAGQSKWISNEASRAHVHELRARIDAIVIGIGTVLADDPLLTARTTGPIPRIARRVVVDPNLKLPLRSKLVRSLPTPLAVAVQETVLQRNTPKLKMFRKLGVEFIGLPPTKHDRAKFSLRPLLRHLAIAHQVTNVIVEGGPTLMGTFFTQKLIDQTLVFIAPKIAGDAEALPALRGMKCNDLARAMSMKLHAIQRFEDDVMLDYRA